MKGRIIEGQRVQRLKDALMPDGIGAGATHEEEGQDQQQARQDRRQPPDRSRHGGRSESGARGRPWYSPVSVRRNATIRSISCPVRFLPS
jgi:hypothetical protein